ncbi:MAG: hydroxymethylbilane synthase [Coxiellaceae bacterium]|nr:hydroxymethylbilane synthase [Coxiellaceae bacterium]
MITDIITIATRKSPLAMWQSESIQQKLGELHPQLKVELKGMLTQGDKLLATPLYKIGGKALFVKELEKAILEHRADLAVHSIKDMPVELPESLHLAVICEREDPRDAFVSNKFQTIYDLPQGATIGTSSLRRQCQIKALRPDLQITSLRGNVGTRLQKLDEHQFDAIVLAVSGLKRLELQHRIRSIFTTEEMLPGVGQGALGIECRVDDQPLHDLLAPLDHEATRICVTAERQVTRALGGSCQVPIGSYATIDDHTLTVRAMVGSIDGRTILRAKAAGKSADSHLITNNVAQSLIDQGALDILEQYSR